MVWLLHFSPQTRAAYAPAGRADGGGLDGEDCLHFSNPGHVRWTEEGYLFAWRVMLTEKTGHVVYRVSVPGESTGRLAFPDHYLAPGQVERVAYQPDLILATANIIRDDYLVQGYQGVQVRGEAHVSYNGRPAAPLIDPRIDLAETEPGIGPGDWILPEPQQWE